MTPFFPWLLEHGLNIPLFIEELFNSRISSFFALDVIVSALVLFVFIVVETKRLKVRFAWTAMVATLCVGVSFGLPLFLYLRHYYFERAAST